MWGSLQTIKEFTHRHRGKLLVASVVAIGTVIALSVNYNSSEPVAEPIDGNNAENSSNSYIFPSSTTSTSSSSLSNRERAKLLYQARKQFDVSINQFLIGLREKMTAIVDISSTIKQIKELRSISAISAGEQSIDASLPSTEVLEAQLWDNLKVQLHILAKSSSRLEENSHQGNSNSHEESDGQDAIFQNIVDGTYKYIYEEGLTALSHHIQQIIQEEMKLWTVKGTLQIEFNEFEQMLKRIRMKLEKNYPELIAMVIVPADSTLASSPGDSKSSLVLHQLWDVIESPMFVTTYREVVDSAYHIVFQRLLQSIFSCNSRQSPPLASILPQIRSACDIILPSSAPVDSSHLRSLISGPILDSFTLSVFDATK